MSKSKSKKLAKAKADRYFSEWVRKSNAKNGLAQCCTCGTFDNWKDMDCGHFISRRFEATRYNPKNAHPQCKKCNRFEHGNQFAHGQFIDDKYGHGTANELYNKSRMICKRNQYDYEMLAEQYKQEIKNIDD